MAAIKMGCARVPLKCFLFVMYDIYSHVHFPTTGQRIHQYISYYCVSGVHVSCSEPCFASCLPAIRCEETPGVNSPLMMSHTHGVPIRWRPATITAATRVKFLYQSSCSNSKVHKLHIQSVIIFIRVNVLEHCRLKCRYIFMWFER